jgi:hypothetical protein
MSQTELREKLRAWILSQGRIAAEALRDDTPLLEERVLSSLQIPDLILFLERLRNSPVDLERLTGASLRDVNAVYSTFLSEVALGG